MALPTATAFADDDAVPVTCTLALAITVAGNEEWNGNKLKVSGQQLAGELMGEDCPLAGPILVTQDAKVKFDVSGGFEGKIKGSFILPALGYEPVGKIKARVTGQVDGFGNVVSETIVGKWDLEGYDIEGKGKFHITLIPVIIGGQPTLAGVSFDGLTGEVELEDDEEGDEDGDDGDDD